jgi:hypothetical protein
VGNLIEAQDVAQKAFARIFKFSSCSRFACSELAIRHLCEIFAAMNFSIGSLGILQGAATPFRLQARHGGRAAADNDFCHPAT